ncbi:hypothetical protein REPUB_Repub14bG0048600 [Reevesia pubescens]
MIGSLKHVPGFIEKAEELKSKGISEIFLISAYIKTLGLELDVSGRGFGIRSQRFALLIDDLKVKVAKVESAGQFQSFQR